MAIVLGQQLKNYLISLAVTLVLDLLWIGLVANKFYRSQLGNLARTDSDGAFAPLLLPALLVYLLIPFGLNLFAVPKVVEEDNLVAGAAKWGGGFGMVLYGVYELTNYSILSHYSLKMCVVDMLWGTVLCWVVAGATGWVALRTQDRGEPLADYQQF